MKNKEPMWLRFSRWASSWRGTIFTAILWAFGAGVYLFFNRPAAIIMVIFSITQFVFAAHEYRKETDCREEM